MSGMTNQARLASLDSERSKLMARIAKARSEGQSDQALVAQVRALSKERVEIAAA